MKDVHRQRVHDYWQSANQRDWDGFARLLHPDVVYDVPQTRERVRGQAAYVAFNRTYPGEWTAELTSVVADEAQAVSKIRFHIDGQDCIGIAFFAFRDGLISRIVDYWPEPYEPPARMTPVIERY
jgi:ketosteroid isomerase-like protein